MANTLLYVLIIGFKYKSNKLLTSKIIMILIDGKANE